MFRVISLQDLNSWDKVVESFCDSSIYDEWNYLKSLEKYTDSSINLFYYEKDLCRLYSIMQINDVAKCPFFRGTLEHGRYFDMETPYGYGGLKTNCINENAIKSFMVELTEYCKANNIISQFIRFSPFLGNYIYSEKISDIVRQKSTVCMQLCSQEQIFADMDSKNRNMIRKAQKNGLTVKKMTEEDAPIIKPAFIKMYRKTMDRNHADSFYYFNDKYFYDFFDDMHGKYELFFVEYEDKIVSAAIIMKDKKYLHYHLSAANREYMNLAPNNLLLYNAALWGVEEGCEMFHLGGGVSDNDSLFSFKKSFSKNGVRDFYIGSNVFMQDVFNYLVSLRKQNPAFDMQKKFMIKYRQD